MTKPENPRKALGKGLNALLQGRTQAPALHEVHIAPHDRRDLVSVEAIDANPLQPRRTFESQPLIELAQSIRANGVIQPLVVRRAGDRYQLVAGERRLRAAKMAGLKEVPVVIREIADDRLLEITLIENIQREDLNALETARAYDRLGRELNLSAEQIGERTGKDRSTVLNFVRLLQLPPDIQEEITDGRLTAGHARCLLALPNADLQRQVANKAIQQSWSVRQTERFVQNLLKDPRPERVTEPQADPNVRAAIDELQRVLGTRVRIVEKSKRKGGRIEIDYYTPEDLDRIYASIVGQP